MSNHLFNKCQFNTCQVIIDPVVLPCNVAICGTHLANIGQSFLCWNCRAHHQNPRAAANNQTGGERPQRQSRQGRDSPRPARNSSNQPRSSYSRPRGGSRQRHFSRPPQHPHDIPQCDCERRGMDNNVSVKVFNQFNDCNK
jgi:hypothetical protein